MQAPVDIQFHQMEKSEAVIERLQNKLDELEEKFAPRFGKFIKCHVVFELDNKNKNNGKLFNIRINLSLPQKDIVVTHKKDEDIFVVLRDALDILTRKIEEHDNKLKGPRVGHVKEHPETLSGKVVKLFKERDYGFILHNDDEYYFSATNVHGDFTHLNLGDEVRFIETVADEGLQAQRVTIPRKH